MIEIWKPVVVNGEKYEDYQVSNFGRVKSLGNDKSRKTKILKPGKGKDGYLRINLYKNGIGKNFLVHRLVSEAFLLNLLDEPQINHINEDKTDNRVENLEYCDCKYNINHGTHNQRVAEKNTNGKLSKAVLQLTKTGELIKEWPSVNEAGRNGYHVGHVSSCCNGQLKTHKGFLWKYK